MNCSALLIVLLSLVACAHAQKTFSVDFKGSLPDMPASIYASAASGGVETNVYYTFNQTIKYCTISPTPTASCSVVAGKQGVSGNVDGTNSLLSSPISIQSSTFADMDNNKIRKYALFQGATSFVGTGVQGYLDGPSASAQFRSPIGVCSYLNDYYVADAGNFRIRKISDGKVFTVAGSGEFGFSGDNGPALNAKISYPYGLTANSGGVYFIDVANYRIRKIDRTSGNITTAAGNGVKGSTGDNGLATSASVDPYTSIVSYELSYDVYFVDYTSSAIRVLLPDGKIYTVATIPMLALIAMPDYTTDTIYALTSDKKVYMLKTQSNCQISESYIGGKCVPVCYGASLDAACGGPSRGTCGGYTCTCKKGFTGSQCETVDVANTSSSNTIRVYFMVLLALLASLFL